VKLLLATILLGNLTLTSYRSVESQTDSTPFITADGSHVTPYGCALSRDLLKRWGGPVDYGDLVYVEHFGFRVVNDCMAARHKKRIDLWVATYQEEKAINVQKRKVWLIRRKK
jgi:3D (Asp-Asp-Asp) domain-containing protein